MTAMLGYSTTLLPTPIDLTERPSSRSLDRQVIRVDPTFHAERGLQRTGQTPVRVRDHEAVDLPPGSTGEPTVTPYRTPTGRSYSWCGHLRPPREVQPDGRTHPICDPGRALHGQPGRLLGARGLDPARRSGCCPTAGSRPTSYVLADGEGHGPGSVPHPPTGSVIGVRPDRALPPGRGRPGRRATDSSASAEAGGRPGRAHPSPTTRSPSTAGARAEATTTVPVLVDQPTLPRRGAAQPTLTRLPAARPAGVP